MRRSVSAFAVAAIGLWSAGVFAQGRNFSGSWTVDAEKTMAANLVEFERRTEAVAAVGGGGGARGGGSATGTMAAGGGGRGGGGGGVARAGGDTGVVAAGGGGMRSGGGGGRGRGAAGPTTITLDANTFTLGAGETSTSFRLDGTPSITDTPGGKATSKASWKGDKLTIETVTDSSNGQLTASVTWYLEGESLVRETQTTFNGVSSTRKTFFKRG